MPTTVLEMAHRCGEVVALADVGMKLAYRYTGTVSGRAVKCGFAWKSTIHALTSTMYPFSQSASYVAAPPRYHTPSQPLRLNTRARHTYRYPFENTGG